MASGAPKSIAPLAISIGEPAGIGPETILKAWLARGQRSIPPFAVMGGAGHLQAVADHLGLNVHVRPCKAGEIATIFEKALPVVGLVDEYPVRADYGHDHPDDARTVGNSIIAAVQGAQAGRYCGIVTAPINKNALYKAGFEFPGHTEFLADLASRTTGKSVQPVMMLAGPQLRTVPVTIHLALGEVIPALTGELIVETCRITARDLTKRFGLTRPRLAVSGLNPHAGENGSMGREEIEIIVPAIEQLRAEGLAVEGPLPADTMFHASARQNYDVAICMYHDQALIPAKTLAFDDAVNVTLGLPFIRTSPDHGTAYNIAGKGIANPSSMIAAIKMAGQMALHSQSAGPGKASREHEG